MTDTPPPVWADVQPGSRLEDLLATYAELKPRADELGTRLKSVTDGIKAELTAQRPDAQSIDVAHDALTTPLRLTYVEKWTLDSKRLKADDPTTYVSYARKSGAWVLKAVS